MKISKHLKKIGIIVFAIILVLAVPYFVLDKEHMMLDDAARSDLPGRFVALSDGVVHYELKGPETGPMVVLVHGFSVPYYLWDPTFDALVAEGFRVLRYDLYGRGFSDRPEKDYDLDLFLSQLSRLVETLHIRTPFDIMGLSMGGPIVAAFANRSPKKVRSVTLIDPLTEPITTREIFPANVPLVGEYVVAVYAIPFMLPAAQKRDFFNPDRFPDWIDRYQVQMRYKGFRRAIISTLRYLMRDADPVAEYEAIGRSGKPVLLFRGAADTTITPENIETIKKAIPTVRFHEIPEAGHVPHFERPEVVTPIVIDFLRNRP
jgi:pimeloyl-ACP methyl ester carboxylesterase